MEAVGSQVIIVFAIPILAIGSILAYYRQEIVRYVRYQFSDDVRIEENQQQRDRRQNLNDQVCSICLNEPKVHEVSSTCGHTFCAQCILALYRHNEEQIKCPLCREGIHLLFKLFPNSDQTIDLQQRIRQYNLRFDDNRPLLRRLKQFPYMLKNLWKYFLRPEFWLYLMRTLRIIRILLIIFAYILMPFDLLPQQFFGVIGFIDDIFFVLFIFAFVMVIVAIQYYRNHH